MSIEPLGELVSDLRIALFPLSRIWLKGFLLAPAVLFAVPARRNLTGVSGSGGRYRNGTCSGYFQKSLNRFGANSVYRTVC